MAGVAGNLGGLHLSHTVDGYLESCACGFADEAGRTLPRLIVVECFRDWLSGSAVKNQETFSIRHFSFLIFHLRALTRFDEVEWGRC